MINNNLNTVPALFEVYKKYFEIGAAVNPHTIPLQRNLLIKHYSSFTAENEMKFESIHPEPDRYNFELADQITAFAEQHGKKVRGHTLVWHGQTPDWVFLNNDGGFVDRETLLQRMRSHIHTVMERYHNQIYCWDVVNEAISDEGTDILRMSKWREIIGDDFIAKAFEYAHQADPKALLFYNDYNESFPEKREKIYKLVKSLVEHDVPIHGIGMQAHWNIAEPSLEHIRKAIERYASLGLQIHITELDISVFEWEDRRTDLAHPTAKMMELQQKAYAQIFQLFREYRDVITNVTFWGAADDYTWLDHFPVRGRKNWPFVFDEQHLPKLAFWDICKQ